MRAISTLVETLSFTKLLVRLTATQAPAGSQHAGSSAGAASSHKSGADGVEVDGHVVARTPDDATTDMLGSVSAFLSSHGPVTGCCSRGSQGGGRVDGGGIRSPFIIDRGFVMAYGSCSH